MKNIFILLSVIFYYTLCDKIGDDLQKIFNNIRTGFLDIYEGDNITNINTESIHYGLSYSDYSVVKALIKTVEPIKDIIKFVAFLKSENEKKEYVLHCANKDSYVIECVSNKGIKLNTEDKYYLYYNRSKNESIIFDYEYILEDDKRVSLIFNPKLYENQTVYRDNKKIIAKIDKKIVSEGYLYLIRKSKKIVNYTNDNFNQYINLNNIVYNGRLVGYRPKNILDGYKEAIRRGYHIVEADLQFTRDKVILIMGKEKNISNKYYEDFDINKVLMFEELLKLCKEYGCIIEAKFPYLESDDSDRDGCLKVLWNFITAYDMVDSVIFNDNINGKIVSSLKKLYKDITVSISNVKTKADIDEIKDKFKDVYRIICNIDGFNEGTNVNEDIILYGLSKGMKVKVSVVEDQQLVEKISSWGANYITSSSHPFLIQNEYEKPIAVKCVPIYLDDLSECKMGDDIELRDNEIYSIYYSNNIYKKYKDLNMTPIGEFRYEDTKINQNMYYIVKYINFKKGIMQLITSNKARKNIRVKGVIGPKYDNVAECYKYNFTCEGNNKNYLNCIIHKDKDKLSYNGEYIIYFLENYSFNEEEIEDLNLEQLHPRHFYSQNEKMGFSLILVLVSVIFLSVCYYYQGTTTTFIFNEPVGRNKKQRKLYEKLITFEKN